MRALILAASMLLCVLLAASAPASSAPTPAAGPDPELVKLAAEVRRTGPKLARLWPGYWPPDQAFILYRPGEGALLVAAAPPPPAFEPLPAAGLPKPLRGRAWFRPGDLEGVRQPFILGYPIGGGRTAVLVLADADADSAELSKLIFHEQFHDYQRTAFRDFGGSQFVAREAVTDRLAFAAAAETERRVLAAAVTSKPGKARAKLLHQYLALRRARERTLPSEVLEVERDFERIEGTAKFVDRVAASTTGADKDLADLIAEALSEDLFSNSQPFLEGWFRSRSYGVGAALTYLLRELDPAGWRAAIEGGAALDERVAALSGFDKVRDPTALAEAARAAFGYGETRAALEPRIQAAERKEIRSVEQFLALDSYRVVFEVVPPLKNGVREGGMGFATGPGGMTQLGDGHLVLPDPEVVNMTLSFASLTVRGRPFMSEGSETRRYTVLLPSAPNVNGRIGLPAGEHRFGRLDLTADGLELRVERPVTVVVSEDETMIRIADAADRPGPD